MSCFMYFSIFLLFFVNSNAQLNRFNQQLFNKSSSRPSNVSVKILYDDTGIFEPSTPDSRIRYEEDREGPSDLKRPKIRQNEDVTFRTQIPTTTPNFFTERENFNKKYPQNNRNDNFTVQNQNNNSPKNRTKIPRVILGSNRRKPNATLTTPSSIEKNVNETIQKNSEPNFQGAKSDSSSTRCYGELGCFGRKDFFDIVDRPLNLWPDSPEEINLTLHLFTKENPFRSVDLAYNATKDEIMNSPFDPRKKTKFIVHGYLGEFDDMDWMGDMKDLILKISPDEYNVFGVDWSKGAKTVIYNQAVANTRVVGAALGYFINSLSKFLGTNLKTIHIIGHSLGAHASGYAGEKFQTKKIGRITGLDPAGPDFRDDDNNVRLDSTDADYVDVVHTDYGNVILEGLGLEDAIGNDDFYPNSGYRQPGCGKTKAIFNVLDKGAVTGVTKTVSCNHQRSWRLFLVDPSTVDEKCQFIGYECKDYDSFEAGDCGDCGVDGEKCARMDLLLQDQAEERFFFRRRENKKDNERRLYFKTTEKAPFCLHHYQVTVHIANDSDSSSGELTINMKGQRRDVEAVKINRSFKPGQKYSTLLTYGKLIGSVDEAEIDWDIVGLANINPIRIFGKKKRVLVEKLEIKYMSNIDERVRKENSALLCMKNNSGSSQTFETCKLKRAS